MSTRRLGKKKRELLTAAAVAGVLDNETAYALASHGQRSRQRRRLVALRADGYLQRVRDEDGAPIGWELTERGARALDGGAPAGARQCPHCGGEIS